MMINPSRVVMGLMKMAQKDSLSQAVDILERLGADREKAFGLLQNKTFMVKFSNNMNDGAENDQAVLGHLAGCYSDDFHTGLISGHDEIIVGQTKQDLLAVKNIKNVSEVSSEMEAIYRLSNAVKKSEPSMTHFLPGSFVRRITDDGLWMWGRIKEGFSISKPISSEKFIPLARVLELPSPNDMSELTLGCARSWVGMLKKLTGIKWRLAHPLEWERATATNYPIVSLNEQVASDQISISNITHDYFEEKKLANPFVKTSRNLFMLGGELLHEEGRNRIDVQRIRSLLTEGVTICVCDFSTTLNYEASYNQGIETVQEDTPQFRIAISKPKLKEAHTPRMSFPRLRMTR